jgi:hypothetical protein
MKLAVILVPAILLFFCAPLDAQACPGCGKDKPAEGTAAFGAEKGGCPMAKAAAEAATCEGPGKGACKDCPMNKDGKGCACKDCPKNKDGKGCACKDCPMNKDGKGCACKDCPMRKEGKVCDNKDGQDCPCTDCPLRKAGEPCVCKDGEDCPCNKAAAGTQAPVKDPAAPAKK